MNTLLVYALIGIILGELSFGYLFGVFTIEESISDYKLICLLIILFQSTLIGLFWFVLFPIALGLVIGDYVKTNSKQSEVK